MMKVNFVRNPLNEPYDIQTVSVPDERGKTAEKQNRKQPSRIADAISVERSELVGNLDR